MADAIDEITKILADHGYATFTLFDYEVMKEVVPNIETADVKMCGKSYKEGKRVAVVTDENGSVHRIDLDVTQH